MSKYLSIFSLSAFTVSTVLFVMLYSVNLMAISVEFSGGKEKKNLSLSDGSYERRYRLVNNAHGPDSPMDRFNDFPKVDDVHICLGPGLLADYQKHIEVVDMPTGWGSDIHQEAGLTYLSWFKNTGTTPDLPAGERIDFAIKVKPRFCPDGETICNNNDDCGEGNICAKTKIKERVELEYILTDNSPPGQVDQTGSHPTTGGWKPIFSRNSKSQNPDNDPDTVFGPTLISDFGSCHTPDDTSVCFLTNEQYCNNVNGSFSIGQTECNGAKAVPAMGLGGLFSLFLGLVAIMFYNSKYRAA